MVQPAADELVELGRCHRQVVVAEVEHLAVELEPPERSRDAATGGYQSHEAPGAACVVGQPPAARLVQLVDIVDQQQGRLPHRVDRRRAAPTPVEQAGGKLEHAGLLVGGPEPKIEAIRSVGGRSGLEPHDCAALLRGR